MITWHDIKLFPEKGNKFPVKKVYFNAERKDVCAIWRGMFNDPWGTMDVSI